MALTSGGETPMIVAKRARQRLWDRGLRNSGQMRSDQARSTRARLIPSPALRFKGLKMAA
jgi:hypothetical protein